MVPPRRPRYYNKQERDAINPWKEEWLKMTTPGARRDLARTHIFPAIFNHWSSIGIVLSQKQQDERTEVRKEKFYIFPFLHINEYILTNIRIC
jgi:hypothetical protein